MANGNDNSQTSISLYRIRPQSMAEARIAQDELSMDFKECFYQLPCRFALVLFIFWVRVTCTNGTTSIACILVFRARDAPFSMLLRTSMLCSLFLDISSPLSHSASQHATSHMVESVSIKISSPTAKLNQTQQILC